MSLNVYKILKKKKNSKTICILFFVLLIEYTVKANFSPILKQLVEELLGILTWIAQK